MVKIWLWNNYIEIFGAATGIIYVFLEIRQTLWLWPLGVVTSAVYVWIFFTSKLYADMSLQIYYVIISVLGWYWWIRGGKRMAGSEKKMVGTGDADNKKIPLNEEDSQEDQGQNNVLSVTRLKWRTGIVLSAVFVALYFTLYLILSNLTDSPVPEWDAFLTSLSIIATWMLARKIYEHWYLWIIVNTLSLVLYFWRGLYPTVVLYFIYGAMSFIGLRAWKKTIKHNEVPAI